MPNRPSVLVFSRKGYIKRMPADLFATQVRESLNSTTLALMPNKNSPHAISLCPRQRTGVTLVCCSPDMLGNLLVVKIRRPVSARPCHRHLACDAAAVIGVPESGCQSCCHPCREEGAGE